MVLQGYEAQVDVCFGLFRDSANLTQDRCTVCSERTIRLEIILDAPDRTPRWRASCGILFWSIQIRC
jgi:hypothetical protein